eukprot:GHVP01031483.1.p1 GENE.GHVP01031483.1~~GHVP01031483.1.p1  ORF type:complete len:222 (+),score=33.55 GHVP01031483.1:525-1190(+)
MLLIIQETISKQNTVIEGEEHKVLNRDFIECHIRPVIDQMVYTLGFAGLSDFYELEDIDHLLSFEKEKSVLPESRTEEKKNPLKLRRQILETEMEKRKKKLSLMDSCRLELSKKTREILKNELQEGSEKRDIVQERIKYGLNKRLFYPKEIIKNGESIYEVGNIIGDGSSGIIYEFKDLTKNNILAMKVLYRKRYYQRRKFENFNINEYISTLGGNICWPL